MDIDALDDESYANELHLLRAIKFIYSDILGDKLLNFGIDWEISDRIEKITFKLYEIINKFINIEDAINVHL